MAKAKKIDDKSLIHFNLVKLESKINEFQNYLQLNSINSIVSRDGEIKISSDDQEQLHKEILVQIKMQDALFVWVPLLEKLKEGETTKTKLEVYGDAEINGMFKDSMDD